MTKLMRMMPTKNDLTGVNYIDYVAAMLIRVIAASVFLVAGIALMKSHWAQAFEARNVTSLVWVCVGGVSNSIAVAIATWPRTPRRPKVVSPAERRRIDESLEALKNMHL